MRDDGVFERPVGSDRTGLVLGGKVAQRPGDERARLVGVVVHHLDDRGDVDRVVLLVPAVVVGHHGDGRVGDFRLARELRLRRPGHADDVGALGLIAERFGERRELRPLHADIGPAVPARDALGFGGGEQAPAKERRDRMGHRDMRHAARAEEGRLAQIGAIDELVDHHEHARIELPVERPAGGKRDDVGDAGPLQRVDVGAIVDRRRREPVAAAVPGEEDGVRARRCGRSAARRTARPTASITFSSRRSFSPGR